MKLIEKNEIDRLLKLKSVSMKDKQSAHTLYRKYVSTKDIFCLSCKESVRQLFNKLTVWWTPLTNYKIIKELNKK